MNNLSNGAMKVIIDFLGTSDFAMHLIFIQIIRLTDELLEGLLFRGVSVERDS